MTTAAVRGVLVDVKVPMLDDIIRGTSTAAGTGNPSFTLPNSIVAGDTIFCFLRLNKFVVSTPVEYAPDWGIFSLDNSVNAMVDATAQPFDVIWVRTLSRYADGTEAGDTITFDLTMFDSSGGGSYIAYDGEWDIVTIILNGDYYVNGGYLDGNPEETNGEDGYLDFSAVTIPANKLTLWAAGGYSSGTFYPSTFPTLVAASGNLQVYAKFYTTSVSIAEGGMTFNGIGYFAAVMHPIYIVG